MKVKSVVLVWASHSRRAETLAAEMSGKISFQYESRVKGYWLTPLRYVVQGWKTWRLLEREQPEIIVVQAPPVFAALLVALWCKLRGKIGHGKCQSVYAIDCHSGTFYSPRWSWTLPLQRFLSQRAAITIVASENALDILKSWDARGIFLVDGIPSLSPETGTVGSEGEARVAVISSFDYEEPVEEIFAAARLVPHVTFYLSGNAERILPKLQAQKPENIILTGFLQDSHYSGLLKNVHGVIVLTKEPNVLNSGAYEALAMAKPIIVSDWPQMRRCFTRGFIYVKNTPVAIATGVKKMLDEQAVLTTEIIAMRSEFVARRQHRLEEFTAFLEERALEGPVAAYIQ